MSLSLDVAVVAGGALLAGSVWWARRELRDMSAEETGGFLNQGDPGVQPADAARAESLDGTFSEAGDLFGFGGGDGGDGG